ncbi:hypothetical protein EW026_g5481 [Hermanssonia centrifuga]|uniref:Uncharacterized protein n=1 Tax=Hermanssonia centrifuga TaxID=98765 RepID=A0A4S4KE04_9APHY|nr:hypothetical protein EW026_g5481 [Hermanssonia centrifuga]
MYYGVEPQIASSQTGYKWSFASKTSKADSDALKAARAAVGAATYNRSPSDYMPVAGGSGRVQGPTLPSQSDLTLAREDVDVRLHTDRDLKRKRNKKEEKERVEDMVGPKEVGRDGMLEKKRARREADRSFREKGDDGFEADESTLMGGGDSFRERLAKRDAARKRVEEKKFGPREEREAATRERADVIRQKDRATMDMFMQMAKEKFG